MSRLMLRSNNLQAVQQRYTITKRTQTRYESTKGNRRAEQDWGQTPFSINFFLFSELQTNLPLCVYNCN